MYRITQTDVRNMFGRYVAAVKRHGVDASDYVLLTGSKTYGNAWRVMYRDPSSGGISAPFGISQGFLGMTARESYDTLAAVSFALESASELVRAND